MFKSVLFFATATALPAPQVADRPAHGPANARQSNVVVDREGRHLIRHTTDLKATTRLDFVQIGKENTQGFVVNTVKNFDTSRLPATFKAALPSGEVCTATLVGPNTLLTAAHCVDAHSKAPDGRWRTVEGTLARQDGSGGVSYGSCLMAPAYEAVTDYVEGTPRNGSDFALCELDAPLAGVRAETITLAVSAVTANASVMLAGYGCTQDSLTNFTITSATGGQGRLNVGMNTAATRPSQTTVRLMGRIGSAQAIICPGDSGGAAFGHASLDEGNDFGWRVVAVNSAVGPSDDDDRTYISYLAALSSPEFKALLAKWKTKKAAIHVICGDTLFYPNGLCRK